MYNLSSHYENIYQYLETIIADPRVAMLHPFGSTQPENLEIIRNDVNAPDIESNDTNRRGPMFIFYDQEPLDVVYNKTLLDYITNTTKPPWILVSTERDSEDKNLILEQYTFAELNYFFHIFAAADWYRGHEFIPAIKKPIDRTLTKTYITFNRLTSNRRVYRSLLVNELYKHNLLNHGHVSYSKNCPDGGSFESNLLSAINNYNLPKELIHEAIANITQLPELRIDFEDETYIPNQSMLLSPVSKLMESFIFLVTETCFFQSKTHLTEKIFKPIVLRMPFILVGCAYNLEYLRSYGFKTFGDFWDESYDTIEDPIKRLQAITKILKDISKLTSNEQKSMLLAMQPILEHNYYTFNDPDFVKKEWENLKDQLRLMCRRYQFIAPYKFDLRLRQSVPI